MWKLLKIEVEYFRWLYILSLIFVVIINVGLTIDGKWIEAQGDFPGLRVIWMGIGIVVLFFSILFNRKSGRLRNIKLLPISNFQISLVRLLAFLGFWISLLIILTCFYIYNFATFPKSSWLINFASLSGIMLIINSIPVLYSDFYSTYFKRSEKIMIGVFWSILWLIYIWLNTIFMTYLDFISPEYFSNTRQVLKELYFTPTSTVINLISGLIMFFISIYTFTKRKLYLE